MEKFHLAIWLAPAALGRRLIFDWSADGYVPSSSRMKPYTSNDLLEVAVNGEPIDPLRVVATYADPKNWVGVYGGSDSDGNSYSKVWAWRGPLIVGPELAQNAMRLQKMNAQEFAELERETRDLQTRCRRGYPPSMTDASNDLHADCYGQLGKMLEQIRTLRNGLGMVTTEATIKHLSTR